MVPCRGCESQELPSPPQWDLITDKHKWLLSSPPADARHHRLQNCEMESVCALDLKVASSLNKQMLDPRQVGHSASVREICDFLVMEMFF